MRPRLTASLVALSLIAASVLAAAPASAADFDPALGGSSSAARQWKINVLGKILGKAAPTAWQREQLANANKYNQAWETLEAQFGTAANKGYSGPPDSYADYVIRKKEIETTGKITVNGPGGATVTKGSGKTFSAPATGPSKFVKGVGGGATVLSGGAFGLAVGNGIADVGLGFFGLDKNGLVCGQDNEVVKGFASVINGTDCSVLAFDPLYVANGDASGEGWTTAPYTDPKTGNVVTYLATFVYVDPGGLAYAGMCFNQTKPNGSQDFTQVGAYRGDTWRNEWITTSGIDDAIKKEVPGCGSANAGFSFYRVRDYEDTNARKAVANFKPVCWMSYTSSSFGEDCKGGEKTWGEATADPLRTISCTIVGTDGLTYSAESEPYQESQGEIAAPVCPSLPEGVAPKDGEIAEKNGATVTPLAPIDVNQDFLDWWGENPECRSGACAQELYKIENGQKLDCFENTDKCMDWFEDPNKAQNYECWYNDKKVDQANCYVYAGMFKPGRVAAGNPYADPLTGKWSGGQNAPGADENAYSTPIADPDKMRSCIKEAGAFNPIEWVMVPVQCAIQWATVPRPAVIKTNVAALTESWDKTLPAKFGAFMDTIHVDTNVTGCGGVRLDVQFLYDRGIPEIWFGAACPGTMAGNIALVVRTVLTLLATWAGIVGVSRAVGGTIGYQGLE